MEINAAILKNQKKPIEVKRLFTRPLEVGQVLVKIHFAGICGAQIGEINGANGDDPYLPHLLGHEGSGVILETGPGVKNVKEGESVVCHWRKGVGIEANPPKYDEASGGVVGAGPVATWATHAVVSENRLTPVDPILPMPVAALMGCAMTTAFGLINNEAKLKFGQNIVVFGSGGVGLNIVFAARLAGAAEIGAVDISVKKGIAAYELGATRFFNLSYYKEQSFLTDIKKEFGRVDVAVDCTGSPKIIDLALNSIGNGGVLILVGQPPLGKKVTFSNMRNHYCGKTIIDSQGGLTNPTEDIPRYSNLLLKRDNLLEKVQDSISHFFCLSQIEDALKMHLSGDSTRVMLDINRY